MDRVQAKVAFFIERKSRKTEHGHSIPREVTAVFVDEGNYRTKECYAHDGQHGTCDVAWIAEECKPAKYEEYKPLYDEMNGLVGYDIEVIDAAWWIAKAMDYLKAVQDYYEGKSETIAA